MGRKKKIVALQHTTSLLVLGAKKLPEYYQASLHAPWLDRKSEMENQLNGQIVVPRSIF